jgi:hypothetical protein
MIQWSNKEFVRFLMPVLVPRSALAKPLGTSYVGFVGQAIVTSLGFHPAANVSTPMAGEFPPV